MTGVIAGTILLLCLAGCSKQLGTESGSAGDGAVKQVGIELGSEGARAGELAGSSEEALEPGTEKVWRCTRIAQLFPTGAIEDEVLRRFYDDKGNLIKEESYSEKQELTAVTNYGGFLEDGNPTWRKKEFYQNQKLIQTSHTEYLYEDGTLKETYETTKNTDGLINQTLRYKMDEFGNFCGVEMYYNDELLYSHDYHLEYVYDEEERLIRINEYGDDGEVEFYRELEYDENGNVSKEITCEVNGKLSYMALHFYDENGNLSRMDWYDENGVLYEKVVYKYEQFVIKK